MSIGRVLVRDERSVRMGGSLESARGAQAGQATGGDARSMLHAAVAIAAFALPLALGARASTAQSIAAPVYVGAEEEDYLRSLQVMGVVPLGQWSIRGFSKVELDRMRSRSASHPWSGRAEFRTDSLHRTVGTGWTLVPVRLDGWFDTSYPFGGNDGAVWRGKGLTTSLQGGVAARWRWFSATLYPQLVWTQNAAFELMPVVSGNVPFAHPLFPGSIDLPQRFGGSSFARVHPGQSTVSADVLGVTAGVSTANQWWGPMSDFPYILGNNAPGFPHAYAGSSAPWNIWVGKVHGRIMYGRLSQSAYSEMPADSATRLAAAIVGSFSPRGAPGLELGFARFFHTLWTDGGPTSDDLALPFRALLKDKRRIAGDTTEVGAGGDPQNQLGSIFFRWAFPRGGVEVYGEFGREDHNANTDDLRQEPEHASTYGLGVRKAGTMWGRMVAGRAELMNYQRSTLHHHRAQGGIYVHGQLRQGHTHLGQLLGSGIEARAGAGARVAVDTYGAESSWGAQWTRLALLEAQGSTADRRPRLTVQHSLGVEHRRQLAGLEVGAGLTAVYEMNRHFAGNAANLELSGSVRWPGTRP